MFRFVLSVAILLAAAVVTASPAVSNEFIEEELEMVINATSRALPAVTEPNDHHACFCIRQGPHCSPILAASSGTCTPNILRRHQTDVCILRCARFCLFDAKTLGLCQELREWLEQKIHKIFRANIFPDAVAHQSD